MANAQRRLMKEAQNMVNAPPPYIQARPSEKNFLEWHYVITGPPDSPYHEGEYWGKLIFPSDYPYAPPQVRMMTPSGRFQSNTRLCLSISDYHPDTWNPAWSVSSILTGLLSFMLESTHTTGSINTSDEEKKALAKSSRNWNREQSVFVGTKCCTKM